MSVPRPARKIIFALFFLSGAASLANEVVWFKYLTLTFGATTSATATLLAVFMGGLALGSWLFSRPARRLVRPALIYALLEAGVGVFALATPALFALVNRGYVFAYRLGATSPPELFLVRFALSTAALLPPTILMGATFPVLAREVETGSQAGRRSGGLYGINTLGAVAGVAACGFFSIPVVGLRATLLASACLSLLAALLASFLPKPGLAPAPARSEPPDRRFLAVAFVTGGAAMADEVLWTRILVLHLGSSVYAFSLMLAIYLLGLVLGSLAGALFPSQDARRALIGSQVGLGFALLLQVLAFGSYSQALVFAGVDILRVATYGGLFAAETLVTLLYLIGPTFLMGFTFVQLLRAASRSAEDAPESAGAIYSANTLGAILGSLVAGFLAIPTIGSQNALLLTGLAALGVALALAPRSWLLRLAPIAFLVPAFLIPPDRAVLSAGVFSDVPRRDLLFYREDVTATVAVKRYGAGYLSLELNGVNVAGTSPDLIVIQKLQGHLPLSFVAHPRKVLHIGFGSGGTAYAVSLHPVSEIRIVEISPEVLRASARFFPGVNHGVLQDPRVLTTINDGRNFVLASPETFDAILSDSIHPRYAGNGSLYTEEYFRLCAKRLAPGGVISMWLPMYSLLPENYRAIVRAFQDVFPNVSIWYAHNVTNSFTIVLATPERTVDLAAFTARLRADPAAVADLARIGESDPAELLSNFMLAPDDVARWVADTAPHSDDRPVVEYESGRTLDRVRTWYETFSQLIARRSPIEAFVRGLEPGDPLSERVRKRFAEARTDLERHRAQLIELLRTER
jgi:spermidine synthase